MQESESYRKLVSHFHSKETRKLFSELLDTPEVRELMKVANKNDVPIMEFLKLTSFTFGLSFDPKKYQYFE